MHRKYILLVEDNNDDELLTRHILEKCGLLDKVIVAHDGVEALDFLSQKSDIDELPLAIILDIAMPKLNGLEVLRTIKENPATRNIPAIMFSSSREQSDINTSYQLGANSYVAKPVKYEDFYETAQLLTQYWRKLNQTSPC